MDNILPLLSNISISLPSFGSMDPTTLEVVLGVAGIFLFLLLFAFTRHHLIHTSLKGLWAGLFIGAIVILGVEGGGYYFYKNYIVGNKTRELPQNMQVVVNDATGNITKVLGAKIQANSPTASEVVSSYRTLEQVDAELVRSAICKEEKQQ